MTLSFTLVPRQQVSVLRSALAPVAALIGALLIGGLIVMAMGRSPLLALHVYLIDPLRDSWAVQEILLKATPLILIGTGLLFCFRANRWNIGAEGQFICGAICGSGVAILTHAGGGYHVLPLMLLAGTLGGMAYGALPAVLRNRFGISEILTSLMLVYVADLLLDYLVRGPWRDPKGFNFPQSVAFSDWASLPLLFSGGRLHLGIGLAVLAGAVSFVLFRRSLFGFALKASGEAPRAANFAGFDEKRITLLVFLISGGLAGLAGIIEIAGQVGQLKPGIGQGLGFTAIIVAFLGRLSPVGCVLSALVIAVLLVGAESAQIMLKLPFELTRFFMGLLLLCVLLGDSLNRYKIVTGRG